MTSYNPGTPTTPRAFGGGIYAVDSFRGEGTSYTVNLRAMTCDCPHYQTRLAGTDQQCKHMVAALDYAAAVDGVAAATAETFNRLIEKARTATTEALESLLPVYEQRGRLDIALAIRAEMFDRQGS